MKLIHGKAKNVRIVSDVSGTKHSTDTTHTAAFEIDGISIRAEGENVIHINEGDTVRVAGELQYDGVFKALAFYNMTNKVIGETSNVSMAFFGYIIVICGIITLPILIGFLIIPIGKFILKESKKIDRANELAQTGF